MNLYVLTKNHAYQFYKTTIDPMVEIIAYALLVFVRVLFFEPHRTNYVLLQPINSIQYIKLFEDLFVWKN